MKKSKTSTPGKGSDAPLSVAGALKIARQDLTVKESGEVELGEKGSLARHFARVRIASFKDLQRLSFVPEGLDEKAALEAISRDNDAAFEAAQRAPAATDDCGCHDRGGDPHDRVRPGPAEALRNRFAALRRQFNPALSRELSKVHGRELQWHDPVVMHVYRWVDRLRVARVIDIGTVLLKDIVVAKNATLGVSAAAQLLRGNRVSIHTGGRIVAHGSYLKIWCQSIEGNLP